MSCQMSSLQGNPFVKTGHNLTSHVGKQLPNKISEGIMKGSMQGCPAWMVYLMLICWLKTIIQAFKVEWTWPVNCNWLNEHLPKSMGKKKMTYWFVCNNSSYFHEHHWEAHECLRIQSRRNFDFDLWFKRQASSKSLITIGKAVIIWKVK